MLNWICKKCFMYYSSLTVREEDITCPRCKYNPKQELNNLKEKKQNEKTNN